MAKAASGIEQLTAPLAKELRSRQRDHYPSARGCPKRVCAVTRRRFPVGASPTRQPLQPEATGAAMEVTKWLKPSDSASRIGDGASVQAATRVNAEQALYGVFFVKGFSPAQRIFSPSSVSLFDLTAVSSSRRAPFAHRGARRSRQGLPSHQSFRMLRPGQARP